MPVFVAVNDGTLPLPLLVPPIELLSLVQVITVPGTLLERVTIPVAVLLQRSWLVGLMDNTGVGLTMIVKVEVVGDAAHPLAVAVTV